MDNEQRPDGSPSDEDHKWDILEFGDSIFTLDGGASSSETTYTEVQRSNLLGSDDDNLLHSLMNQDAADGAAGILSTELPSTDPGNSSLIPMSEPELNSNGVMRNLHEAQDEPHYVVFDVPRRFQMQFCLQTKNEAWKKTSFPIRVSLEDPIVDSVITDEAGDLQWNHPSLHDFKEPKEFLLSGHRNLFCINVGKPPGPEKLVILNSLTQTMELLPPLIYTRHPVLMHVKVNDNGDGDYKIVVAGSSTSTAIIAGSHDLSLKTEVFDSVTGVWESCSDLPCPSSGLHEFQTGAYYKDSESRESVFCVADVDTEGAKGVLMFDLTKKQWDVQGKRRIPLFESPGVVISHIASTKIVACGGLIFVLSEQVLFGRDQNYLCIHKLNPDSTFGSDGIMWKECFRRKSSAGHECPSSLLGYPEFTSVPLSATLVEIGGSVFVFSEQEPSGDSRHISIFIHILKLQDCNSEWEKIVQLEKKRHRSPNWTSDEITAFLKVIEEAIGLNLKVGKEHWNFISQGLKKYGFNRGPQACEYQWGTLLQLHKEIENDLIANNMIHPSGRANYWERGGSPNKLQALQKFSSLERYETMDKIRGRVSRKSKRGAPGNKPSSSSVLNDSTITSVNSSGLQQAAKSTPASGAPLTEGPVENSKGKAFHETPDETHTDERPAMADLNSTNKEMARVNDELLKLKQLEVDKLKLELEILRESNKRPRKQRKKNG